MYIIFIFNRIFFSRFRCAEDMNADSAGVISHDLVESDVLSIAEDDMNILSD